MTTSVIQSSNEVLNSSNVIRYFSICCQKRITISCRPWRQSDVRRVPPSEFNCKNKQQIRQQTQTSITQRATSRVITFCVSCIDDAKCIVVTRVCVSVCLSVCLSAAVRPHYCTDPDATWGRGRGCRLVVHYWADLQSGHGLRCYGNITRTLATSLRPSGHIVRTDGWAGSARVAGR